MTQPGGESRVLLTGGSGLVGHAILHRLRADGEPVLALGRDNGGDLARSPWPSKSWDVIVHCAARLPAQFGGPEEAAAAAENRMLDDRALDLASATGAHLVYVSSASVWGRVSGEITEATPVAPDLVYAREKLATEAAITARGISATVFRLVAPYGPRQSRQTVLRRFIDLALTGMPLRYFGSGSRTQDFLHVDDAATAVALAVRHREPDCFVLASGEAIAMCDLARLVVEATGSKSAVEPAGVPDQEEGRTVRYRIDHLHDRLGFRPAMSLRAGIAAWASVRRRELVSGDAP